MARDNTPAESHVTADRQTIRSWAEEHDVVPVRNETRDEPKYMLARESERDEHSELSWDEFAGAVDDEDLVVVRHGDTDPSFEVTDRTEALGRAAIENEEIEEALMRGETVQTEITETTVVERTIVEEATLESEIVDREVVESTIVDAELLTSDVESCTVTRIDDDRGEAFDMDQFEPGARSAGAYDVEVTVDEGWSLTKEVVERMFIDSRIVDHEASETDTLETDTIAETVDLEGVQQTILEGELLDAPETAQTVVEQGSVESHFREGDVIETALLKRKTVEEELTVRKLFEDRIEDGETMSTEAIGETVVEDAFVTEEEVGMPVLTDERRERAAGTTEPAATDDAEATATDAGSTASATETAGTESTTGAESTADATGARSGAVELTDDDEGKTVVDSRGVELGMVTEVGGQALTVDPEPSLTDRIRSALGWGDADEDDYRIDKSRVVDVTDDRVELRVDEDETPT